MDKVLGFLTGKRTILIAVAGILSFLPEWADTLPAGSGVFAVVASFVQAFWAKFAIIFGALKVNRVINGG